MFLEDDMKLRGFVSGSTILPQSQDGELFASWRCYSNLQILGIKPDDVGKMTRDKLGELDLLCYIILIPT